MSTTDRLAGKSFRRCAATNVDSIRISPNRWTPELISVSLSLNLSPSTSIYPQQGQNHCKLLNIPRSANNGAPLTYRLISSHPKKTAGPAISSGLPILPNGNLCLQIRFLLRIPHITIRQLRIDRTRQKRITPDLILSQRNCHGLHER